MCNQKPGFVLVYTLALVALAGCSGGGDYVSRAAIDSDGTYLVLGSKRSGRGQVYLLRRDGLDGDRITHTGATDGDPAISPDDRWVVFSSENSRSPGARIDAFDRLTGAPRMLTAGDMFDRAPSFSPDGERIVFARGQRRGGEGAGAAAWEDWDVFVMNADGRHARQVTMKGFRELRGPCFSRDGRTILFAGKLPGSAGLSVMAAPVDADGPAEPRTLIPNASDPCYSRDGRYIAFIASTEPEQYEVWIARADGSDPRQLTHLKSRVCFPVFSPGNRSIMFLRAEGGGEYSLWVIDADGGNLTRVAERV